MKQTEFKKEVGTIIKIPICYSLDDDNNVVVDFDSIREEYEEAVGYIEEILEVEE